MFAKAVLVSCLALVAVAAPDRRPSSAYGAPRQQQSYQPPQQQQSYQPPQQQQSYQPPQQQTYQAPQQQTYQAPQPSRQSYEEPKPSYSNRQNTYQQEEEGMPFDFAYAVQDEYSGNDFAHNSNSDGKVTTGEYRVLLPDGRTQIVTYTADGYNGFQAEVTYEGEARPYEPQAQASYQQPRNQYQAPQQQQSYQPPQQQQSYQPPQQQNGYGF